MASIDNTLERDMSGWLSDEFFDTSNSPGAELMFEEMSTIYDLPSSPLDTTVRLMSIGSMLLACMASIMAALAALACVESA